VARSRWTLRACIERWEGGGGGDEVAGTLRGRVVQVVTREGGAGVLAFG